MATTLAPALTPHATRVTLTAGTPEEVTVGVNPQQIDIYTDLTDCVFSYTEGDTTTLAPIPASTWFPLWIKAGNHSIQNPKIYVHSTVGGAVVFRVL
jgi:hypothetical protein